MGNESIVLAGQVAELKQGDRVDRRVIVERLLEAIKRRQGDEFFTETPIFPVGTVAYRKRGDREFLVLEETPRTRTIIDNSGIRHYLAFPFIVYIFYLEGGTMPQYKSRIFFRNTALASLDDRLCVCNLTHAQVAMRDDYKIGAVCMHASIDSRDSLGKKIAANMKYYWETGFNSGVDPYNGFFAGFKKIREIDPRVASFEAWTKNSAENPLFINTVPWPDAGLTVREAITFSRGEQQAELKRVSQLADIMYQLPETNG